MNVLLNGESRVLEGGMSLGALIDSLGLERGWVVAERNSEVPDRAAWNDILLQDGDQIELVRFMGGGS